MSGHSKWSQIKRQKIAGDIKKGQVFSKLANAITITVRQGGSTDPAANFKLKLVIEKAVAANMPKENINRAIERGLGTASGGQLEEVIYEGYGPAGVAILVEAATDNRNRTTAEVKSILERAGGSLAGPGSVAWMFDTEGAITVKKDGRSIDDFLEIAANLGAEDVVDAETGVEIYTKPGDLEQIKNKLSEQQILIESAEIAHKPKNLVTVINPDQAQKILGLMEKLDSLDDIQKVWSNFDIPDELLKQ